MLAPEQKTRSLPLGQHHDPHFGMLEADAVERVGQFDIDAEIIGIELQPIAGIEPALLGHVERQGRDRPVARKPPMPVSGGIGVEGNHRKFNSP